MSEETPVAPMSRRGRTCKKIKMEADFLHDDELNDPDFNDLNLEDEEAVRPRKKRTPGRPRKIPNRTPSRRSTSGTGINESGIGAAIDEEKDGSTDEDEEGEEDIIEDFQDKDVYDFDANSQISVNHRDDDLDKNGKTPGKKRPGRKGRNVMSIYGGLSTALKTQSDFDTYTRFIECPLLNTSLDNSLSNICKPCNSISNLYYGPSAALQSLLSRNFNQDLIIQSLRSVLDWNFDNKGYKITSLCPVVHQPILSCQDSYAIRDACDNLAMSIKYDIQIDPCYIVDRRFNCFVNDPEGKIYYRPLEMAAINDACHLGKQGGLVDQLIVPKEVFTRLYATVRPSKEEIDQYCESEQDNVVLEPYSRVISITDKHLNLIAFACVDVCDSEEMPINRERVQLDLYSKEKNGQSPDIDNVEKRGDSPKKSQKKQGSNVEVKELVSDVIDWVSAHINEKDYYAAMKYSESRQIASEELVFIDTTISVFNGRQRTMYLTMHLHSKQGNLEGFSETVYNLALGCEEEFTLTHYMLDPNQKIPLENRHHMDPTAVLSDTSMILVPDIIYDNLRTLVQTELASTSSPVVNNAIISKDQSMQKFVILDTRTEKPLCVAVEVPIKVSIQIDEKAEKIIDPSNDEFLKRLDEFTQTKGNMDEVKKSFNATHNNCRVVIINGLVYAMINNESHLQVDKLIRILPVKNCGSMFPVAGERSIYCSQAISGTFESSMQFMKVHNEETNLSTLLPMVYFENTNNSTLGTAVAGLADRLIDSLTSIPIKISIYEIAMRLAQRSTLQILTKQFLGNNQGLEPPETWNICNFCLKELKGAQGIIDHEQKHLQQFRIRCDKHSLIFERKTVYRDHMEKMHPNDKSVINGTIMSSQPLANTSNQAERADEEEEEENPVHDSEGFKRPKDPKSKSGYFESLTKVFSTNLSYKCEAIQCENCKDYFPRGETMTTHLETCDSVSFSIRTPLPKSPNPDAKSQPEAIPAITIKMEEDSEPAEVITQDAVICGLCGTCVLNPSDLSRHFSEVHFKCVLCEATQRSVEELSIHYSRHIEINDFNALTNESAQGGSFELNCDETARQDYLHRLKNVIKCHLCGAFHGTHHNFYFHQWSSHGVVHPPLTGEQLENVGQHLRSLNETQGNSILNSSEGGHESNNVGFSKKESRVVLLNCKLCSKEVRAAGNEYAEHLATDHQMTIESHSLCKICAEITNSPHELSDHIATQHSLSGEYANAGIQTVFNCIYCVFYAFHAGIMNHCRIAHQDSSPAIYQCTFCPERFSIRAYWKKHMETHTENYNFQCQECGRTFRLRNSLLTHIRNHHPDEPEHPCTCEYCGLVFVRNSLLQHHIKNMHDAHMPFECLHCHKRFDKEFRLRRHQKESHSGTVKCEICNKLCDNIKTYAVHRRKHFKIRVYQCNDCNASFKSKAAMKRHIRVEHLHLGPEKYECQICGKVVTQIGMHMLTHKGSRYECTYCGKGFTKSAYYNEHIRIHKGELPFECHICHRRFNKKSNLNVHLKFHEKHRDADGNYLELKHKNRISVMFGDAHLTPEQRKARMNATRLVVPPTEHMACGPDEPGAFNIGGTAWAASEACAKETKVIYVKSASNERMDLNGDDHSIENRAMDQFDKMLSQGPIK